MVVTVDDLVFVTVDRFILSVDMGVGVNMSMFVVVDQITVFVGMAVGMGVLMDTVMGMLVINMHKAFLLIEFFIYYTGK